MPEYAVSTCTTDIQTALDTAHSLTAERNARIMGGAERIGLVSRNGLADELPSHVAPIRIGSGIHTSLDTIEMIQSSDAVHLRFRVFGPRATGALPSARITQHAAAGGYTAHGQPRSGSRAAGAEGVTPMSTPTPVTNIAEAGAAFLQEFAQMWPRERSVYGFWPFGAAYMGLHDRDGALADFSSGTISRRLQTLDAWATTIERLAPASHDGRNNEHIDLATLRWVCNAERFALREIQPHRSRPMHYNDTLDVSLYIRRNYAPLDERLQGLLRHLRAIPDALDVARTNLDFSVPIASIDLQQARRAFRGHIYYMQKDLLTGVSQTRDSALAQQIEDAAETAIGSIADLVDYLSANAHRASAASAIGEARFMGLLREFDLIDLSLDDLRRAGQANLDANRAQLLDLCRQIDPSASVPEVASRLQDNHPAWDALLPAARDVLASLRNHIVERDLVGLPFAYEPIVDETLPFHRWGFASMDSPGVFEAPDANAYYYVTSPDADWNSVQKNQWMRRFNYPSIANTSAHEAYPGHYVQSMHKRLAPTPVQQAFDCFTHWEAWAHYSEQMMLDEGYGTGAGEDAALAMRVAQLQGALLRNARYMVAIGLHCDDMSVEEATQVIMDATQMDELPARQEAERGTFDPAYGNYCLGKMMLLKLRDDVQREQQAQGTAFTLRKFHDDFLSHGAPPFPIVRARMLQNDDGKLL